MAGSGHGRGGILSDRAVFVDEATIAGELFDVGYFPALRPGAGRVRGEVWEIPDSSVDATIELLDGIESYREGDPFSMYLRRPATATLASGEETLVETYEWNRSTIGMERIPGGCWKSYRNGGRLPMETA